MMRRQIKDNGLREHFANHSVAVARAVAFLKESERLQMKCEESIPFDSLQEPGLPLEATAEEVLTKGIPLTDDALNPSRPMSMMRR